MHPSLDRPILIVSPFPLYPPRGGAASRVLGLAAFIGAKGMNVTVLCVSGFFRKPGRPLTAAQNVRYLEAPIFHPSILRQILSADVVQFEYPFLPHLMLFARLLGKRIVLDEHGVELKFWDDILSISRYLRRPPDSPRRIALWAFRSRGMIYFLERTSTRLADYVFTVNELDSRLLIDLYGTDSRKLAVVPTCVQDREPESEVELNLPSEYVVFLGAFTHSPNAFGARIAVEQIIPIVQRAVDVPFLFVGGAPPPWLTERADPKTILVMGEIPNIDPVVSRAKVAICPIWHGSGSRVKILDYMRCGKAIVSTHKGAEGLEVTDGVNIVLRDSVQDFAEAIVWLLRHPDSASKLGEAAKLLVASRYSWERYEGTLMSAYGI